MDSKYNAISNNQQSFNPFNFNNKRKLHNGNSTNNQFKHFKSNNSTNESPKSNATNVVHNSNGKGLSIDEQRHQLPVYKVRKQLINKIMTSQTLIVIGETGCGKTTQIPQMIYDSLVKTAKDDCGVIAITQPRRVAAITISKRVALEQKCTIGDTVGYTVRFEDFTSPKTKIKYMTDGSLLREALTDKFLRNYRVIILDEAHERTINTDVLFGIVKDAQRLRAEKAFPLLKIIIMSATMDVDHFSKYFNNCETIYLAGRTYPVKVLHTAQPQNDYTNACLVTLFQIHKIAPANHDVLIFLTGQEEIEILANQIRCISKSNEMGGPPIRVFPLYAQLNQNKQLEVFQPLTNNSRKVILSTNIAETSLTIRGIKYVIDSGMVKRKTYDSVTGMDTLRVTRISQDQAWQRTGRAGRDSDGFCYRTYTMNEYRTMSAVSMPEILRSNISATVLQLLALGINCRKFDFLDKPSDEDIENALKHLHQLGAITKPNDELTPLGRNMSKFPLDPRFSKILLCSPSLGCLEEMLSIVAILSGENIFCQIEDPDKRVEALKAHAKFESLHGDHLTLLNVYNEFKKSDRQKTFCHDNYLNVRNLEYARNVRRQLSEICERLQMESLSCGNDFDQVRKCLITGLYNNIAEIQRDHNFITLSSRQKTKIHPSSVLNSKSNLRYVLFTELVHTTLNFMRVVTTIEPEWIEEMIPNCGFRLNKSIGDTSDIISDSSGVGTNSDSAGCSIGHPSTTVVCMEPYQGTSLGHLSIHPGEVIEVVGSTDCGLLEGYVRGVNRSGFFPAHCVQEVNIRQKNITNVSISMPAYRNNNDEMDTQLQQQPQQQQYVASQYISSTGPRVKKAGITDARTVILHRAKRGFGFVLRGAKAASPLMQLKPSDRCPGLQYLDDVDPGGVADLSGLRPGDFLLAINGEDVRCASHEHVVDLIRTSGSLVSMTVVSQSYPNNFQQQVQSHQQGLGTLSVGRQCATLPRKMPFGPGKMPAPMPPRRDPKTTLSVGRARAKSMVAGLEGGGEKDDDDDLTGTTKSSSAESIHQQSLSAASTPTQAGPGTPVQPRTASIKARPTSSRITAAELEELFQRQQGETNNGIRYSTMMTSSRFQSGTDSGAATPPLSPQKGPIVYASVADMKRKKTKNGTLRGKPCGIPQVSSDLKRTFHSTPDLQTALSGSTSSIWSNTIGVKGHRSQDDMYTIQRQNLPPPTHPPPPPPVGQVVKVDVSRGSEYESTAKLQKKLRATSIASDDPNEIRSSFKPASNAKLYASPQDLRNVGYHSKTEQATRQVRKTASLRANNTNQGNNGNQYAQPIRGSLQQQRSNTIPSKLSAPPIPDPDYSLSESEGEDENSVLLAHNTKMNEHIALMPSESSGNSNTSGSSTGSSSIPHSFSVDEIQKMRVKLKSSKSYPNELLRQDCLIIRPAEHNEEGDNSSSGVSSDQEVTITTNENHTKTIIELKKPVTLPVLTNLKKTTITNDKDECSDDDDSPSPPAKGFQRHNSLTRKQAATIAMNRAMQSRNAVSLVKLPPPIETEMEVDNSIVIPATVVDGRQTTENIVLAPPPQFCDCLNAKADANKNTTRSVRIVGAVPK